MEKSQSAQAQQQKDRRSARRKLLKGASLVCSDRHATVPCAVQDISQVGARLRLTGKAAAPDKFDLIIETDGFAATCEVVWRNEAELGVRFVGPTRIVATRRTQKDAPNKASKLGTSKFGTRSWSK